MDDNRNQMEQGSNGDSRAGEIRFKKDKSSTLRGGVLQTVFILILVVLTSLVTTMVLSRRMIETTIIIENDSNFSQIIQRNLERYTEDIYNRRRLREILEEVGQSLVGVSTNEEALDSGRYEEVYTGVVMNSTGYIMVPYAAVAAREETGIFVRSPRYGELLLEAEYVGRDLMTETAVIRVDALMLPPPRFGDSSAARIAESVAAMGSAFGDLDRATVTFGVLSTLNKLIATTVEDNREVRVFAMEMDGVVNRANNGGVVVNMAGDVIGITSLSLTQRFDNGLGVVISSNEARSITRSIINIGDTQLPFMGVYGGIVTEGLDGESGFYIQRIAPDGTADRAGLRPTDIILSIDDVPVVEDDTIDEYIRTKEVGDVIRIRYLRVNEPMEVEVTLYGTRVE